VQLRRKGWLFSLFRIFCHVLTLIYSIIANLRLLLYGLRLIPARQLPAYVISIGNITVGGTGKTPFVLFLAEKIAKKGDKVGIISRGYGSSGKPAGSPANRGKNDIKSKFSINDDEEFPLPANVIRYLGADRYSAGMKLCEVDGVKTIILDDGFQHLKLKRDLNIVLIDATNPFGSGFLLPAGSLREPLWALRRADIFVITHADLTDDKRMEFLEARLNSYRKKIVKTIHKPQHLVAINRQAGAVVDLSEVKNRSVWEFCGIGNPYQFHKTLGLFCNVKGMSVFLDHHYYTKTDMNYVFLQAKKNNVKAIITTEKDALRLKDFELQNEIPVYYLKIEIEVVQGDEIIKNIVSPKSLEDTQHVS